LNSHGRSLPAPERTDGARERQHQDGEHALDFLADDTACRDFLPRKP
jgi:hypothetical protein